MREIDMLKDLPQATDRPAIKRTIQNKIIASYRDERFYNGDRANGYGTYVNDGRWKPVAEFMVKEYGLKPGDTVLQCDPEKGFLLDEFRALGMDAYAGFSKYKCALLIGIGTIYTRTLFDAIQLLCEFSRRADHSFITLGSFDTPEDERIFREWSLLGCTILSKPEWIEVLKHCGYTGDYKFVTAKTLGLV